MVALLRAFLSWAPVGGVGETVMSAEILREGDKGPGSTPPNQTQENTQRFAQTQLKHTFQICIPGGIHTAG